MFNVNLGIVKGGHHSLNGLSSALGLGDQRERREDEGLAKNGFKKPKRTLTEVTAPPAQNVVQKVSAMLAELEPTLSPAAAAVAEPAPQPEVIADAVATEEELTEAQKRAVEQRKAAEALLAEARELEERLAREAAEMRENRVKAQRAVLEQQAVAAAERQKKSVAERNAAEFLVEEYRKSYEAALADVTAQQKRLEEARRLAQDELTILQEAQRRAAEFAQNAQAAEADAKRAAQMLAPEPATPQNGAAHVVHIGTINAA